MPPKSKRSLTPPPPLQDDHWVVKPSNVSKLASLCGDEEEDNNEELEEIVAPHCISDNDDSDCEEVGEDTADVNEDNLIVKETVYNQASKVIRKKTAGNTTAKVSLEFHVTLNFNSIGLCL